MTKAEKQDKIEKLLKQVCDTFDKEDTEVRARQIRQWRKLKYFWAGFTRTWWSSTAHDWRVVDNLTNSLGDDAYYDKPINVFRAYLESIIAALSITIPTVTCFPDDAESDIDISTAKAGNKIADLIAKHNDATLLWLHALFIYCTEGMVACYNYTKEDYKYGEYTEPKKEETEETVDTHVCPDCGTEIPQDLMNDLKDEYDPEDVELQDLLKGNKFCPQCQAEIEPEVKQQQVFVTRFVGITTKPKSRQCMEVYGGLYVKVPNYAMKQADVPYLKFSYETHYSNAIERFKDLTDKVTKVSKITPGYSTDDNERWGRVSTQYFGEEPVNNVTIANWWLRPASFNVLGHSEDIELLKEEFPDGARCVFINELYGESENECLDDHWTLTNNPLSDNIHFDPLGLLLTSVQEITNDLNALILQTIEHGIPQTFATPDVINFNAYQQMEVSPGSIVPTKPQSGKALEDGFYTVKTASLSSEVLPYSQGIQEMGQLVSGALPSLFGGNQGSGGKTAAQYSMSRAQAQQRLGNTWKMLSIWWKDIFGKAIPAFIKEMKDDERYVEKNNTGGFINTYIRQIEVNGKIGSVELESSEELPTSWAQKKDVIMQLLQSGNQEVMASISSPENIPLLAQAIGLEEFYIPGADDREKQYEEIRLLVQSAPIPDGMGGETSSVPIEPDVDNNAIEAEICRSWLISSTGRLCKVENPDGYKNVLLHMQAHTTEVKKQQMPQPPPSSPMGEPAAAKLPMGASNANT